MQLQSNYTSNSNDLQRPIGDEIPGVVSKTAGMPGGNGRVGGATNAVLSLLFNDLQTGEYINVRALHVGKDAKKTKSVYLQSLTAAFRFVEAYRDNPEYELYVGVFSRYSESAKKEAVAHTRVLWADLDGSGSHKDGADSKPKSKAELLEDLKRMVLEPSLVIDSGHGYHAYWLIETTDDAKSVEQVNKNIADVLGSDHVGDAARIMRIDGTYNRKHGDTLPVQVVGNRSTYQTYRIDDLAAAGRLCDPVIKKIHTGSSAGYKSSSERDFAVIGALIIAGMSDEAIAKVFLTWPVGSRNIDIAADIARIRDSLESGRLSPSRLALEQLKHQGDHTDAFNVKASDAKATQCMDALRSMSRFRYNTLNGAVEMADEVMDDVKIAALRHRMRELGFGDKRMVDDALITLANENPYHPIVTYLDDLKWDGGSHIEKLASYATNPDGLFPKWLKHWLVGAVARVFNNEQNSMLVLEGPQDIGKSTFAAYLVKGIANRFPSYGYTMTKGKRISLFYKEGAISPDNKDDKIAAGTTWIWEVGELAHTTRRADVDALKFFLTMSSINERKPYAVKPSVFPAVASFIGTVNDDGGGFLNDPTGTRRFLVCTIEAFDFAYSHEVDVDQVWAEAVRLYLDGWSWRLTEDEKALRDRANQKFAVVNVLEDVIAEFFDWTSDPADPRYYEWYPVSKIVERLQLEAPHLKPSAISVGRTLKSLGVRDGETRHSPEIGKSVKMRPGIWEKKPRLSLAGNKEGGHL